MRQLLFLLAILLNVASASAGNLDKYLPGAMPHPICGINPNYPAPPPKPPFAPPNLQLPQGIPFAICKSLAFGFSADNDSHSGRGALIALLAALGNAGFEEKVMKPLSPELPCKISAPLGLGPMNAPPDTKPECNKILIIDFIQKYDLLKEVVAFKRIVSILDTIDLEKQDSVERLKQAKSVLTASSGAAELPDLVNALEAK